MNQIYDILQNKLIDAAKEWHNEQHNDEFSLTEISNGLWTDLKQHFESLDRTELFYNIQRIRSMIDLCDEIAQNIKEYTIEFDNLHTKQTEAANRLDIHIRRVGKDVTNATPRVQGTRARLEKALKEATDAVLEYTQNS